MSTATYPFYQKLSPEQAGPYLGAILGQQEISLEADADGYGAIKAHDEAAGIIWETRQSVYPLCHRRHEVLP